MPLFSWTPYTSVTPCCSSDSSPRDRPVQHAVCYLVIAEICALLQEVPRTQHIQASRHSRQKELQFSTVIWLKELSHHNSYSFRPGFWHVLRGLVDGSEPEATSGLPASDSCANCEHCERSDAHEVGPARRTWGSLPSGLAGARSRLLYSLLPARLARFRIHQNHPVHVKSPQKASLGSRNCILPGFQSPAPFLEGRNCDPAVIGIAPLLINRTIQFHVQEATGNQSKRPSAVCNSDCSRLAGPRYKGKTCLAT